jgi:hypothetical protein
MDDYAGRLTIIASSTMVHHRIRCMVCKQSVDNRVVFLTNDARVLHTGCVPNRVKVPNAVLLQAIRRLERMVERARVNPFHDALEPYEPDGILDPDGAFDHDALDPYEPIGALTAHQAERDRRRGPGRLP